MTISISKESVIRDFAYSKGDPRHEGHYKETEVEDDADSGEESDPWSSFVSGGPNIQSDDAPEIGATPSRTARALYDFIAENPTELGFFENDILHITYKQCDGWLVGYKGNQVGLIPENYVELNPESK
ncbi:HOG (high osmolarity glycerol) pathway protein [Kickxella alabastrina]|uniref:HOG (High osmolarity glycerol) pathway protein n=1 Tax=Kickxella alabastrina TaxID=61397 RepID=A0ACC1IKV2_9FUNG|nr:HOG (high osmolarity glycerol) pathway protein [Kickxella alabastrina]